MLAPRRPGHAGEGFAKAVLLADMPLTPYGPNEAPTGHRAAALAAGFLDPRHDELVLAPRKQVSAGCLLIASPSAATVNAHLVPAPSACTLWCQKRLPPADPCKVHNINSIKRMIATGSGGGHKQLGRALLRPQPAPAVEPQDQGNDTRYHL